MSETRLDLLFYEIEAHTEQFDAQIARARKTLKDLGQDKVAPIAVTANTRDAEADLERVKKKVKEAGGAGGKPAVVVVRGDVTDLEKKLTAAKAQAATFASSDRGRPLTAKVDADIAAFTAKLARIKAQAAEIEGKPITAKLTAQSSALDASLKKTTNELTAFSARIKSMSDAGSQDANTLAGNFGKMADALDESGSAIGQSARQIATTLRSPLMATAAITTALVGLAVQATATAAEFDGAFKRIQAALPSGEGVGTLQREIVALSTSTPRTVAELGTLAEQLAAVGESDPAQIASDLKVIALAADALGKTDASPFVELLDGIADSFRLTSGQARDAFVQIVALSKGKISIDDLSSAFGKGATSIAKFTSDSVGAARALTALIDANVNSRKLIPGVLGILEASEQALVKADQAAAAGQLGSAAALRDFAETVNKTQIQSKGLLPVLGELYEKLGRSAQNFAAAGLSGDQFTIAMRASEAAAAGAGDKVETLRDSMDRLQSSAAINNKSAAALSQLLKNDLASALNGLGATFLPPVISLMEALANRFNAARRNALAFQESIPQMERDLAKLAKLPQGPATIGNQSTERGRVVQQMLTNAVRGAGPIVQNPSTLDGQSAIELGKLANLYAANTREGKAFARETGNSTEAVKTLAEALGLVQGKLAEVAQSEASDILEKAGLDKADEAEKLAEKYKNAANAQIEKNRTARESFKDLSTSISEYASALGITETPLSAFQARQAALAVELDKAIAKLPLAERAAARSAGDTLLDQLAQGGERLRASQAIELTDKLAKLLGTQSTDVVAKLRVEYDAMAKELEELARQSDQLANSTDAGTAAQARATAERARAAIPSIRAEEASLIKVEEAAKAFASAQKSIAGFQAQTNAGYRGATVSLEEYRAALITSETTEETLRATIAASAEGTATRTRAEQELKAVIEARQKLQAGVDAGIVTATSVAADTTIRLGDALLQASQNGLALVQILGKGNGPLAAMLASVTSLGNGIKGLGGLAKGAGGFGKLFGSASGIASALGPLGSIAGGAISLIGGLTGKSAAEKQRDEQVKQAQESFSRALGDFVKSLGEVDNGAFTKARDALATRIGALVQSASLAAGFDGKSLENVKLSAAGIREYQASLFALAASAGDEQATRLRNFAVSLYAVAKAAEDAEADIAAQQAAELRVKADDLRVRSLRAQGLSSEADALRDTLAAERELGDARRDYAGAEGYVEYLRALEEVTALEVAAAAATRARARALSELDDILAILGGSSADNLVTTLGALGTIFPAIADLASGLDLNSTAGLTGFTDRLKDLFRDLLEGGITDLEQPLVDAIKRILGSIGDALGDVAESLDAQLGVFNTRVEVFGLSLADQFAGLSAIFASQFTGLGELLGNDLAGQLGSEAGRTGLKQRITDAITAILADGKITDAERGYLDALQQLLTLIGGTIDQAATDLETTRQNNAKKRSDRSTQDIALGNLTGEDAFRASLDSFGDAFSSLFDVFDLDSLGSVAAAQVRLRDLAAEIDGLSDAEVLAKFGLTRDEMLAAILSTDSGLDGLSDSLRDAADAARDAANASADFAFSLDQDYLNSAGMTLQAQLDAIDNWVKEQLERAEELGILTPQVRQKIEQTGINRRTAAINQQAERDASAAEAATKATASGSPDAPATDILATRFAGLADAQSLLTAMGVWNSMLVETRDIRTLTARIASTLDVIAGVGALTLSVPSLPPGAGAAASGAPFVQVIINVSGPINGQSAAEAGQQLSAPLVRAMNEALGRAAGIDRRNRGDPG